VIVLVLGKQAGVLYPRRHLCGKGGLEGTEAAVTVVVVVVVVASAL